MCGLDPDSTCFSAQFVLILLDFRNIIGTIRYKLCIILVCPDVEHIQRSTPGFQANIIPESTKMKCAKIPKY